MVLLHSATSVTDGRSGTRTTHCWRFARDGWARSTSAGVAATTAPPRRVATGNEAAQGGSVGRQGGTTALAGRRAHSQAACSAAVACVGMQCERVALHASGRVQEALARASSHASGPVSPCGVGDHRGPRSEKAPSSGPRCHSLRPWPVGR